MNKRITVIILFVILIYLTLPGVVSSAEGFFTDFENDTYYEAKNLVDDPTLSMWKNHMFKIGTDELKIKNLHLNDNCTIEFDIYITKTGKETIDNYLNKNRVKTISNKLLCIEQESGNEEKEILSLQYSNESSEISLYVKSDAASKRTKVTVFEFDKKYHIKYNCYSFDYAEIFVNGIKLCCADKFGFTSVEENVSCSSVVFHNPFAVCGGDILTDNIRIEDFSYDDNGLFIRSSNLSNAYRGINVNISPVFIFNHRIAPGEIRCLLNGDTEAIDDISVNGKEITVRFKEPLKYGKKYVLSFDGTRDIYGCEMKNGNIYFTTENTLCMYNETFKTKSGNDLQNLQSGDEIFYSAEILNKTNEYENLHYLIVLYSGNSVLCIYSERKNFAPGDKTYIERKLKVPNQPGEYTLKVFFFKKLDNLSGVE